MGYHLTTSACESGCTLKTAYPRFAGCEAGFRFLNTSQGRWISRDPVGIRGGSNASAFSGNRCFESVDYLGLLAYSLDKHEFVIDDSKVPERFVGKTWSTPGEYFTVSVSCRACRSKAKDCFEFDHLNVSHRIEMYGITRERWVKRGNNGAAYDTAMRWTRLFEQEHMTDLSAWSLNKTKKVAEAQERRVTSERGAEAFASEEACKNAFPKEIGAAVFEMVSTQLDGEIASRKAWDTSGFHAVDPNTGEPFIARHAEVGQ